MGTWQYSINYGPDGEANYANVHDADGFFVGNLRTHHAIEIVTSMNALTAERAARERAEQERDVLRSGAEYVALRKLVKDAYNEGFTEGMREHTSSRGGKPWPDSAAKKALDRICFDCGDAIGVLEYAL